MMRKFIALLVLVVVFFGWSSGAGAVPIEWTVASGGNGHFYEVTITPGTSWDSARSASLALGADWDLASVTSQAEQDFIISLLPASPFEHEHLWIGGNDIDTEGVWEWSNGDAFTYENWWDGEPNDNFGIGEDYNAMNWRSSEWKWNDAAGGSEVSGYVAELSVAPSVAGANLIVNGDFESGNIGFATAYQLGASTAAGSYAITTDPQLLHGGAVPYGDHSTGSGLMMVANGSTIANTLLWSQTVSVVPNTDYVFSAYVSSWSLGSPAELDLRMETMGSVVSTFTAPTQTALWQEWSVILNSGASNSLNINIVNRNIASHANDFAIDDISLTAAVCTFIGSLPSSTPSLAAFQDNHCEDWSGVSQPGDNLQSAILDDADLSLANLNGAILVDATLIGASLDGASLINTNFSSADLDSAVLANADLSFANLTGANLANADLTAAIVSSSNLTGAQYDEFTVFPSGTIFATSPWGLDGGATPWDEGMIPVPEPGMGSMLFFGIGGLLAFSARKRRPASRI